jgi:hypothetical protein
MVCVFFYMIACSYQYMSPVIIPAGYTKRYVDGKISFDQQLKDVETAMQHVQGASDVVLCEGTGHCAVGSIVGLNNAKVASILGCDMVLVGTYARVVVESFSLFELFIYVYTHSHYSSLLSTGSRPILLPLMLWWF